MVKHYVFEAQTSGMVVQSGTEQPLVSPASTKSPALQRILAKKKLKRV